MGSEMCIRDRFMAKEGFATKLWPNKVMNYNFFFTLNLNLVENRPLTVNK